ncbi:MAG: hypothetical protein KF764_07585 [Labilithrix sp.]|nr:hypothetical protein [Labilithrix sp.]MBX3220297.1 hypothetical protein [Labilithrix sp.]
MKTIPIAVACIALFVSVGGCRKQTSTRYTPIGPECPAGELPPGAVTREVSSGGITGRSTVRTYFLDGRVVERTSPSGSTGTADAEEVSWKIPPERIKKLEADLVATGVFGVPSGCWSRPEPIPDGVYLDLDVRHDGRIYSYGGDDVPDAVWRARKVVDDLSGSFASVEAAARRERMKNADGGGETDF